MRYIVLLAALAATSLQCAYADDTGQLKSQLLDALRAAQKGQCPKSMMSAMLQDACERQMPGFGNVLASKGAIRSADFKGMQPTPMGQTEVYRVNFDSASMAWMVAAGPDGKLTVFWSSGQ